MQMKIYKKKNYFILTGAMGAGKSTILKELKKLGLFCVDEPARQILAEQNAIEGNGTPERDPKLFTKLLLSRSIYQFKQMENYQNPVIFDRGIPDSIGYAKLFKLDLNPSINAANQYQYNKHVFFLPAWEEIYKTDDERKMTFEQARQFGDNIKNIYQGLNYDIIEVLMESTLIRAKFIIDTIATAQHA